ncbi:unnamed protein product [Brassica rapa subsp. narinosa]
MPLLHRSDRDLFKGFYLGASKSQSATPPLPEDFSVLVGYEAFWFLKPKRRSMGEFAIVGWLKASTVWFVRLEA